MPPTEHMPPAVAAAGAALEPSFAEMLEPTMVRQTETADGFAATMETWQRGNHDIVRVTPHIASDTVDSDEMATPLVVSLGIHGDKRLHWALTAFAQEYEGPTVGILYRKPQGSAKLIRTEGFDHPVLELEANQADDLISALDFLGVQHANAVTESRGNTRVEIAAAKRPDLFEHRYHAAPVGHVGEGYVGTHMSALRIAADGMRLRMRRNKDVDPLVSELASLGVSGKLPRHSLRARRIEQKAVARSHKARLNEVTAGTQYAPEQSVTFAGDKGDRGVKASKLHRRIAPIQATGNGVAYVETNWGRHGFGRSRRPVREVSRHFKELNSRRTEQR